VIIDINRYAADRRDGDVKELLLGPPYFDDDMIEIMDRSRPAVPSCWTPRSCGAQERTQTRSRPWFTDTPADQLHLSVLTIERSATGSPSCVRRGDHGQGAALKAGWPRSWRGLGTASWPVTEEITRIWSARELGCQALIGHRPGARWTLSRGTSEDFEHTGARVLNPFIE